MLSDAWQLGTGKAVSMESGLEGRNNWVGPSLNSDARPVSMESGLEGRNNSVGESTVPPDDMSQWSPA